MQRWVPGGFFGSETRCPHLQLVPRAVECLCFGCTSWGALLGGLVGRVVGCKSIIHVRIQEENPLIFFIRVESNSVSQHLRRSLSASSWQLACIRFDGHLACICFFSSLDSCQTARVLRRMFLITNMREAVSLSPSVGGSCCGIFQVPSQTSALALCGVPWLTSTWTQHHFGFV